MPTNLLLDTNIVIALFAGEPVVQQQLAAANELFLSAVVLGELCYGARKSGRPEANLQRIAELAARSAVLSIDVTMAEHYGLLKDAMRIQGRPIPDNDIWIAALSDQHRLTLVSRDEHFLHIPGLALARW